MIILLLTLFAIALTITIAGFLLSSRAQRHHPRAAYYTERNSRRAGEPLRARRYIVEERRLGASGWVSMTMEQVLGRAEGKSAPWLGITLILVSIFLLCIYLLRTLLPDSAFIIAAPWSNSNTSSNSSPAQSVPQGLTGASLMLVRISQLDPSQYDSTQEYGMWAYSACSAAAMTELINAYGHHFRIGDILKVEIQLHEITPDLGLLEPVGIERTVARFGFKTSWGMKLSLNQIIASGNSGTPVIVSFPPDRYAGGHVLVVTGGSGDYVYTADSSLWNNHSFTRENFMQLWGGFSAIVTPDK